MKYVRKTDGCWEWTGAKSTSGYGRIYWDGKPRQAHRIIYEHVGGHSIPAGLELDHLCRNRGCVRPEHLEPVTRRINLLRGETIPAALKQRTHCRNGHEFTADNTYLWHGARYCRTCRVGVQAALPPRDRRSVVTIVCVICGTTFTLQRAPGQTPNVCSAECRKARQRKAARDHQRRKRSA